jgi:3-oxoacyl-(acyl-carrier-protein) synthase
MMSRTPTGRPVGRLGGRGDQARFGASVPPVTGLKWAIGHTIAAAGILEAALALAALARGAVPGIANLESLDPACAGLLVSTGVRAPRSKVVLILCRGFAGTNAALVLRGA